MSARTRRRTAAVASAITLAAAVTAMLPGLAQAAPASAAANGTKGTSLTISNGSKYVVMNGTVVNFGVLVRDLAWSPDGKKAAFIDGNGNLDIANPNGSGRVVVAQNPGHQTWSHPTWQVAKAFPDVQIKAKDNLIFTVNKAGVKRLDTIPATAHHGTPKVLALGNESGPDVAPNLLTGNDWANAGGAYGTIVYANSRNGEVYLRDDYLRQQGGALTKGSEPALSPSGDEIVFVRSVAGHDHILVDDLNTRKIKDLTPHATVNYTEPTFSPNGKTIAFRAANGTYTIPANGSHAPVRITRSVGLPAYRG